MKKNSHAEKNEGKRSAPAGTGTAVSAVLNRARAVISALENEERPVVYSFLTFLVVINIRNYLELAVNNCFTADFAATITHFTLAYANLALGMLLLMTFLTGEAVSKVARVVLVCFAVTITVPIIDSVASLIGGHQVLYEYMLPEKTESLLRDYLTFFGAQQGVTLGMRIEIFVVCMASAAYLYIKTASWPRVLLGTLAVYTLIFLWGGTPFVLKGIAGIAGFGYEIRPLTMIHFFLLVSLPAAAVASYLAWPSYLRALVKDIRFTRVLHYALMIVLGLLYAYPKAGHFLFFSDLARFCLLLAALVFASVFSIITNNLADIAIDRISNPARPSVTGAIPAREYRLIAWVALGLAVLLAAAVSFYHAFILFCFIGNYFIYSMPPLRLKRIPFLSKSLIALNSLLMVLAGYLLAGHQPGTFPRSVAAFMLVALTACINFIDIKDHDGDKAEGIRTLPVLLGMRGSRLLIGSFFLLAYALFPRAAGHPETIVEAVFFGIASFLAINVGTYRERNVFIVYLTSVVLFLVHLM